MKKFKRMTIFLLISSIPYTGYSLEGFGGFDEVQSSNGTSSKQRNSANSRTDIQISTKDDCEGNDYSKRIPLSVIQMLVGGNKEPYVITYTPADKPNKVKVRVKPFLKGCTDLSGANSVSFIPDNSTNNFAISLDNSKKYDEFLPKPNGDCSKKDPSLALAYVCNALKMKSGIIGSTADINKRLSQREKVDLCLLKLTDTRSKKTVFTLSKNKKVIPKNTSSAREYLKRPGSYNRGHEYELILKDDNGSYMYDENRPVKLLHASNANELGSDRLYGRDANSQMSKYKQCLQYEEISQRNNSDGKNGFYIVTPEQAAIRGVEKVCATGSSSKIEEEMTNIDRNVGNYKDLNDVLKADLVKILSAAKVSSESIEREGLNERLYEALGESKEECGDLSLHVTDREQVAECATEYLANIETLTQYMEEDKKILIDLYDNYKEAKRNHTPRDKASMKEFKKEYYKKVKKVQDRIGKYSKDEVDFFGYKSILKNFERFGLKEAANTTALFLLNSEELSRINPVSGDGHKKYHHKDAIKRIEKNHSRYVKTYSEPARDLFESGTGLAKHSKKYKFKVHELMKSRNKWRLETVRDNEQKWASYCQGWFGFQRDSAKCKEGRAGQAERYERYGLINNDYQKKIGKYSGMFGRFKAIETEYAKRNLNNDGSSRLSSSDSFSLFSGSGNSSFFGDNSLGDRFEHSSAFSSGVNTFQDPWSAQMSMNGPNPYQYNNMSQYNQNMNNNINYRSQDFLQASQKDGYQQPFYNPM